MKVILVYVGVGVAGFNPDRRRGDREGSWIGHGIASIGASLKQAGHEVELLDLRHCAGWEDAIIRLSKMPADVFGLSVSPVDGEFACPLALALKHYHPKSRVVVGGIHPTIFSDSYETAHVDTIVLGEGELTLVDLLKDFEQGKPWPKKIVGRKPVLDDLPFVDRELFQYSRELYCTQAPRHPIPSITMLAGRGCPFQCTYCQPAESAVFGHPYRIRSPKNVIQELVEIKRRYNYRSITFWDDTFTLNRKWVNEFCDEYDKVKTGLNSKIAACSRADIICRNEDMIERLASIGVDWFVIGFESGSQRVLNMLKKGTTVEQNLQAAKICRKYGIKVFATYMYGLPTETKAEALQTAAMMDKIAPEHDSPFYFVPIPGTAIYNMCVENDLLLDRPSIARTHVFQPAIKGVDYEFLDNLRSPKGRQARQLLRDAVGVLEQFAQGG